MHYSRPVPVVSWTWTRTNIALVATFSALGLICLVAGIIACAHGDAGTALGCCVAGLGFCTLARSSYDPKQDKSMRGSEENKKQTCDKKENEQFELNNSEAVGKDTQIAALNPRN